MKMKLIVTGNTFPVKSELVSLGARWRPDKGGFLLNSTEDIIYYIDKLKKEHPKYNLEYYEIDDDKFDEKEKIMSNVEIARRNVSKVIKILTKQNKLLHSEDFDKLEENADKHREEVIKMLEYVKAYILNKPVDTTLRLRDKKESDCHVMLCGSGVYSLSLTNKSRLNASVYSVHSFEKPSLSVDGALDAETEKRFMKI